MFLIVFNCISLVYTFQTICYMHYFNLQLGQKLLNIVTDTSGHYGQTLGCYKIIYVYIWSAYVMPYQKMTSNREGQRGTYGPGSYNVAPFTLH